MSGSLWRALAETILPAAEGWPSGADVGVDRAVGAVAGPVAGLLPPDFASADPVAREDLLRAAEAADPAAVGAVVHAAYLAYYESPAVVAVLEARHGYPQRPPQPEGYELPPFDESVLSVVRARSPMYREA